MNAILLAKDNKDAPELIRVVTSRKVRLALLRLGEAKNWELVVDHHVVPHKVLASANDIASAS